MSPARRCRAYGLSCEVAFDWPWAPQDDTGGPEQLRISLGSLGSYDHHPSADYRPVAVRTSSSGSAIPAVHVARASDGHLRVRYADGSQFVIGAELSEIVGVPGPGLTLADLIVYLQGPILGLVLRMRGVMCLHASAVVVNGTALAIMGNGGMGKSTTAAVFARRGFPVLTDDVLALDEQDSTFLVRPGLPRVLLWPESVVALWGAENELPLVVDGWEKRYLDLGGPRAPFAETRVKLGAVYWLAERHDPANATAIRPTAGTDALLGLVSNTYAHDLLTAESRALELPVLARLTNHVAIRRVSAPDSRASLEHVCQAILADFAEISAR